MESLAVHLKLTQYCQSTIFQLKKKKKVGMPTCNSVRGT